MTDSRKTQEGRAAQALFAPSQYRALRWELEALMPDALGDVLASWGSFTEEQAGRLARELRAELAPFGLLSREHDTERRSYGLETKTTERKQATALLRRLSR